MKKGKPVDPILERIYLTKKLRSVIDRVIDNCLVGKYQLTSSQFFILTAIREEPHMPQARIARYLGVTNAAVSKQFATLAARNLIRRNTGSDRRESILSLSLKGKVLLEKVQRTLIQHLHAIFGEAKPHDAIANKQLKLVLAKIESYAERKRK